MARRPASSHLFQCLKLPKVTGVLSLNISFVIVRFFLLALLFPVPLPRSVMLSSRPVFCPPLFPPWVSIPNMVIHLGLYQCPPLSCPLSSSCWLHTEGRWGEAQTENPSEKDDGKSRKGRRMRAETHSSCVSTTNRA